MTRSLTIMLAVIGSAVAYAWHQDVGGAAHLSGFSGGIGGQFGVTSTVTPPPTPYFDATFDSSGPSQLSDTLTVGSTTLDLALACDNPSTNISSGTWSCRKAGGTINLTETGTGTSPDYVVGPWGDGWKFARNRSTAYNYFASSDSALNFDGEDIVVELVYKSVTANRGCVGKKASSTSTTAGWAIRATTSTDSQTFHLSDGTTQVTAVAASSTTTGTNTDTAKHIICFVGKSGANLFQCFGNGIAGTAASANGLGSTASTTDFSLLRESAPNGASCSVASVKIWKCSSCLTNASDYTTPAKERADKLMGVYPSIFAGTGTTDTRSRTTVAMHRTYDSTADATYYSLASNAWMRAERRKIGASVVYGFLSEPSSTNIALQSNDLSNASWTKTGGTASANSVDGPSIEVTASADTFTVSATGTSEFIQSRTVTASTTYTQSAFLKRIDSSSPQWVALTATNNANCSTNQTMLAWFDITNCATGNLGTDAVRSEVSNMGGGWCRVQATFPTKVGATTCDPGVRIVDSNGGTDWTGATSGVAIYHWQHQFEVGLRATSPINSTTASATRNADDLRFNGSNVSSIGNSPVTIDLKLNCPQRATLTSGMDFVEIGDATANNRYLITTPSSTNYALFRLFSNVGGATQVDGNSTTSPFTDDVTVRATIDTNDVNLYVNGSAELTDTSASLITSWSTGHFRVGSRVSGSTAPPQCMFDRIRIWNQVATPTSAP